MQRSRWDPPPARAADPGRSSSSPASTSSQATAGTPLRAAPPAPRTALRRLHLRGRIVDPLAGAAGPQSEDSEDVYLPDAPSEESDP